MGDELFLERLADRFAAGVGARSLGVLRVAAVCTDKDVFAKGVMRSSVDGFGDLAPGLGLALAEKADAAADRPDVGDRGQHDRQPELEEQKRYGSDGQTELHATQSGAPAHKQQRPGTMQFSARWLTLPACTGAATEGVIEQPAGGCSARSGRFTSAARFSGLAMMTSSCSSIWAISRSARSWAVSARPGAADAGDSVASGGGQALSGLFTHGRTSLAKRVMRGHMKSSVPGRSIGRRVRGLYGVNRLGGHY